jgi:SAM-dependent methyltransferase
MNLMKSVMYSSPLVYELALNLSHRKNLNKRYDYIKETIGEGSNVLDLGCGTGLLGVKLCKKCNYLGIDLNEKFLKLASSRALMVSLGDVFDFEKYIEDIDVVVACDVLHHIFPRHNELLEELGKHEGLRIIVGEPFKGYDKSSMGLLGRINLLTDAVFDSDGINEPIFEISKRWRYSKSDLIELFNSSLANRKHISIRELGKDIIAIYDT